MKNSNKKNFFQCFNTVSFRLNFFRVKSNWFDRGRKNADTYKEAVGGCKDSPQLPLGSSIKIMRYSMKAT